MAAKIPDLFVVIEELIANGIEIEATDELGRTAAQIAQLHSNEEAHRVIVKYAAAKAAPAMPISSAEEDQLSASLTVLQQQPASASNPFPFPASTAVSRAASRSSSKLSASDSFASNASSRSGGGSRAGNDGHNFLRFSGLFEETIIEENKQKDSSASSGSSSFTNSARDYLPKKKKAPETMERSESIYENYNPSSLKEALPVNLSTEVVQRRRKSKQMIEPSREEENLLSDELSELDVLLAANIDIGEPHQEQKQQQHLKDDNNNHNGDKNDENLIQTRTLSSTAILNAPTFDSKEVQQTSQTLSDTSGRSKSGNSSNRKADWLELLEEDGHLNSSFSSVSPPSAEEDISPKSRSSPTRSSLPHFATKATPTTSAGASPIVSILSLNNINKLKFLFY